MADRHTADTITSDALDKLYAKLDKARKWRDDYARRLDRVLNAVNPVADAPLPHGYDDADRAVRDFAREVRAAIDGQQPAGPAQPVRVRLTFDDPTQQQLADAQKRAAEVKAELTRSENARDVLRKRAEGECHRADAAVRRAATAEQRLARIRDMADNWERRLPATIRTATAAEAVRNAANGDDRPVMFAVTPAPADGNEPAAPPVPKAYRAPAGDPRAVLDRIRDARQWSDVQAQLGMYYGWTAEQSGQRARAYRLAADSLTAAAERNADEAGQDAERFKADCLAACKTIADMHEAATGRTGMGPIRGVVEDVADVRTERDEAARLSHKYRNRAETAEQRLAAANRARDEQAATIRRLVNRTASLERQLADMRKAYSDADARATLQGRRAVRYLDGACEAEAAADRYKTAWRSARKRARQHRNIRDTAADVAARRYAQIVELRRTVVQGREVLRATEDDLADARRRLAQQTPQQRPVSLGTPCAHCGHARNHHPCTGPCCAVPQGKPCRCAAFVAPARPETP